MTDDTGQIEDLDFANCRCSAHHTCQWCHENAPILLDPGRFTSETEGSQ